MLLCSFLFIIPVFLLFLLYTASALQSCCIASYKQVWKLYIGLKITDDAEKNPMSKQTIKGKHL